MFSVLKDLQIGTVLPRKRFITSFPQKEIWSFSFFLKNVCDFFYFQYRFTLHLVDLLESLQVISAAIKKKWNKRKLPLWHNGSNVSTEQINSQLSFQTLRRGWEELPPHLGTICILLRYFNSLCINISLDIQRMLC